MTHPRRLSSAQALRERHPELDPVIVFDPEPEATPSALRGARLAWANAPADATHLLVVQDDMILGQDIARHVMSAARAMPDAVLSFFTEWGSRTAHALRLAAVVGGSWVEVIDPYVPTSVHLMPTAIGRRVAEYPGDEADDVLLLRFVKEFGIPAYASVPNLAQHVPIASLMGNDIIQGPRPAAWWASPPGDLDATVAELPVVPVLPIFESYSICRIDGRNIKTHDYLTEHLGVPVKQQLDLFVEAMAEVDPGYAIREVVAEPLLLQFWLTAMIYGVVAGTPPPEEALRTLAPGSLRRFVPFPSLEKLPELLNPVVHQAIKLGSSIGKSA
ncbi:hypothetical protein [Rhizocola hellebori]|nr:hypothetical protein [Rhizocola hellebori]